MTSTPTSWGLLKQPDKQESSRPKHLIPSIPAGAAPPIENFKTTRTCGGGVDHAGREAATLSSFNEINKLLIKAAK